MQVRARRVTITYSTRAKGSLIMSKYVCGASGYSKKHLTNVDRRLGGGADLAKAVQFIADTGQGGDDNGRR